jgi:hypothetical protein
MQLTENKFYARVLVLLLSFILAFWMFSIAIHDILNPTPNLQFSREIMAGSSDRLSLHITNIYVGIALFIFMTLFESFVAIFFIIGSQAIFKSELSFK